MQIIYLVTAGEYSTHRVVGIFSTRENAETHLVEWRKGEYERNEQPEIAEYVLDSPLGTVWCEQYRAKIMFESGEVSDVGPLPMLARPEDRSSRFTEFNCGVANGTGGTSKSLVSQEHARKVAVEGHQAWLRLK